MKAILRSGSFILGLVFVCIALLWFFFGMSLLDRHASADPRSFIDEQTRVLSEFDLNAAEQLGRLADGHDPRSIAAAIKGSGATGDYSLLRQFVTKSCQGGQLPPEAALIEIASKTKSIADPGQLRDYFAVHGAALRALAVDDVGGLEQEYLARLGDAAKAPEAWNTVKNDPVALAILPVIQRDSDLQDFYRRNSEWLSAVLLQFDYLPEDSGSRRDAVTELLRVAMKYDPLPRRVVEEDHFGAVGFGLFLSHGRLIQEAVTLGVPLDETLEVIFANPDYVASAAEETTPSSEKITKIASKLADISRTKISVWKYARMNPLALRLNGAAGHYADEVLARYGDHDITGLLFTFYGDEKEIEKATEAIARFGDLAVYVLAKYREDKRVHESLARQEVGVQLVPFLAVNGDAGLDDVQDSPKWIDKYFMPDGTPREESPWFKLPLVGAPINVFSNWLHGYPNRWDELGWAAWDVFDDVLLVASFGTSAVVTESGEIAEQGGEAATRAAARDQIGKRLASSSRQVAADTARAELSVLARVARSVEEGELLAQPSWMARVGEQISEAELASARKLQPDELIRATAGKLRGRTIKQYSSFDDFWEASRNALSGKGYEALIANSENSRLARSGEMLLPTAALGKTHDAADLLRIDIGTGRITGTYQVKMNLGDVNGVAKLLKDERYLGKPILTTQTSYDRLLKDIAEREASLARRGLPPSSELTEVKEVLSSNRIPSSLPGGGRLAMRESVEAETRRVYERLFNRLAGSGERTAIETEMGTVVQRFGRFMFVDGADSAARVLKRIEKGWQDVPPTIRKWTFRGLAGAMLFITLSERTLPALPEMGRDVGTFIGRTGRAAVDATAAGLAAATKEFFVGPGLAAAFSTPTFWLVFAIFGLLGTTLIWRSFRPRKRIRTV